jgi:PAS domain S-box-containing protein
MLGVACPSDVSPGSAGKIDQKGEKRSPACLEVSFRRSVSVIVRVTRWNTHAERMCGYSAEEITRKSIHVLSPPGQVGEMHTIPARIRAGRPAERLEVTRVRKDGSAITVSLTVSAIHDQRATIVSASTIAAT